MDSQLIPRDQYNTLPHTPGVYKFFDSNNKIIYVGKAKDLNKRVSSYFTNIKNHNRKTYKLVGEIVGIEIVIVNSEFDALLLENNLIKENQPRYNILLKDDKSYPFIVITNERFPRIFSTRNIEDQKGTYFGPYTSVKAMNGVLDLIHKLYHIRNCSYNLSETNVKNKKYKVCLEYHIGNCLGPCEDLQSENEYLNDINSAKHILKGNLHVIKKSYKEMMQQAAEDLHYEVANSFKQKLELIDRFQTKSLIVNPNLHDIDVFGVITTNQTVFINYLQIVHGTIKLSETISAKLILNEPDLEIIQQLIFSLRTKYKSSTNTLYSNYTIPTWEGIEITQPKIGDKKKLIDLSIKNALYFKQEQERIQYDKEVKSNRILIQLQKDLNLKEIPKHIECFDNSNIQGTNPVSSMVYFKNGKPDKKNYRKYKIKTVTGPDDFASMKEVVSRRYQRLLSNNEPLPNLVLIDGGKGQLSAAVEALKDLNIYNQIPIIGIAKRLEEIYFPEDSYPILINKKSTSLKLLQHLRDEAHRFAITFHRSRRSKNAQTTILDDIEGIGPSTKQKLLAEFKSVKRIREASQEQLIKTIGKSKTEKVLKFLDKKKGSL